MSGHYHDSSAGTQNQGNKLGDRACVRQSKLYRRHESGNSMKDILGLGNLRWSESKLEGAYSGQAAYDHNYIPPPEYQSRKMQQREPLSLTNERKPLREYVNSNSNSNSNSNFTQGGRRDFSYQGRNVSDYSMESDMNPYSNKNKPPDQSDRNRSTRPW